MLNGVVEYEGSVRIDGVLGIVVLVVFIFLNVVGIKIGKVFLIDNQIDYFDDVLVICIDMVMLVVIILVEYLGKIGYELLVELDVDKVLLVCIEFICL